MTARSRDFNKLLLSCIDTALLSLGESAKQSIYFNVEKNFQITRDDIPLNLEKFQSALEKIFGLGSRYLEILIMKNLYSKIDCPLDIGDNAQLEFIKYVDAARQNYSVGH